MKKQIAYSLLTVKSFDDDKRTIKGMASTPEADRVGDIVEPLGVKFKNPAPLLWMHRHDMPVGTVMFGKPTKEGVPFEAKLPNISEPASLKERVDEAWSSVKSGLIRAVSIGFRPIEYSVIEDTGGYRFTDCEIFELSLVSVPANAGATITEIKSLDAEIRAAIGTKSEEADSEKSSSTVVEKSKPVKLSPKEGKTMKTLKEQIKDFQVERAAKVAKMGEIMAKSGEAGETLAADQEEEFETLKSEVESIDKHLGRLDSLDKAQSSEVRATGATPVKGDTEKDAQNSRSSIIKVTPRDAPGVAFARLAKCKALSKMENMPAYEIAKNLYSEDKRLETILKTAVAAGTTSHATWAGPLVGDETSVFADFVEFLRPTTILGKFGNSGVPALRRVPFRTRLISQTSGGTGYWVGEGAPKPVTKFDFADTTLTPLKVANIAVITMELLRDSSPSAELLLRDQLAAALRERLDIDFIDPDKAVSSGVSPASITNGVSLINSTGTDADDVRCDLRALFISFAQAKNPPTTGVWIMSTITALSLSLMVNALGQPEFPGINMNGGVLEGLPVITSEYVPTDSNGGFVFLVNANDIWFADDGDVTVDMSDQASLQMLDNPTNNPTGSTVATSMVSLWQTNCVGFRAERSINWAKRRSTAVAVLDRVLWSPCS